MAHASMLAVTVRDEMRNLQAAMGVQLAEAMRVLVEGKSDLGSRSESPGGRLREKEASGFMPATWTGDKGCLPWAEFAHALHVCLSVLDNVGEPMLMLEWVLKEPAMPSYDELAYKGEDIKMRCSHSLQLDRALYHVLAKCTAGSAGLMVRQAGAGHGMAAWTALSEWFNPTAVSDRNSALSRIMRPGVRKDMTQLPTSSQTRCRIMPRWLQSPA
jgi:hypothetical protein